MIIPPIQGNFNLEDFFIYAACDKKYFDEFGKILINSIRKNSNLSIHLHLFNPTDDQLDFCRKNNVSTTYEMVDPSVFIPAAEKWNTIPTDPVEIKKYDRTKKSMAKGYDKSIQERMMKTYFACARFIRLSEILNKNISLFSMDVDAVFRKDLSRLPDGPDLYVYKNTQFLAGGLYLTGNENSLRFIKEYGKILKSSIENDHIYWSLDQDVLDKLVPTYQCSELPLSYIDWHMNPASHVWTAKGKRKELEVFKKESSKYA